jgi:pilus assembly protein CpaC
MKANGHWGRALTIVISVVAVALVDGNATAQRRRKTSNKRTGQAIPVAVSRGGARLVRFRGAITRFTVADPEIASASQVDGRSVQISGKAYGETIVFVWDGRATPTRLVVSVGVPTEGLTARLKAIFPQEQISAAAMADTVVLTGTVSDPIIAKRAAKLADAYIQRLSAKSGGAGGGKKGESRVLSFLNVEGRQQVQVRAKVAEVTRTALRQMGVNIWARPKDAAGGLLAPSTPLQSAPNNKEAVFDPSLNEGDFDPTTQTALPWQSALPQIVAPVPRTPPFGLHFALRSGTNIALSLALSLLQQKGMAKTLSEPTLVAYSGQKAEFLAGGELPITVPQGLGQTSVQFKKFGVLLEFTPTVLGSRTIHLRVAVTVSELDRNIGSTVAGGEVPGLATRSSQTVVRMRNNQSFAIAGLMQNKVAAQSSRVPLLGDIPILGAFFREKYFDRTETELVILVTANLVRPLKPGEVPPLPGEDEVADPGAMAFFLLGSVDPELKGQPRSQPAGPVGYSK